MWTLSYTFLGWFLGGRENVLGRKVLRCCGSELARSSEWYLLYEGGLFSLTDWVP